ncbi:hypothetical protein J2X32_000629 [Rheinheimera pacifica]|uniref:hypothetical protein n=1 Tax=Rheinheimera pacifica TaxID=173990 RepID=UPI002862FE4C|nr:hypothetical protein [Rheinheimera pacifica]MDR6982021.1 hypothetical protein [Rheinheimera pacifica]
MSLISHPKVQLSYRLLLAIGGGFCLSILATAALPAALTLLGADKAGAFVWFMLLSFLWYSLIILWVISTKRLARTSLILLLVAAGLSLSLVYTAPPADVSNKAEQAG